jgi:hypothetical protein
MTQVILYNAKDGVAIVTPTEEGLEALGILGVAKRSVPLGKPFKIVNFSELPDAPQEAWVVEDSELSDGFGEAETPEQN